MIECSVIFSLIPPQSELSQISLKFCIIIETSSYSENEQTLNLSISVLFNILHAKTSVCPFCFSSFLSCFIFSPTFLGMYLRWGRSQWGRSCFPRNWKMTISHSVQWCYCHLTPHVTADYKDLWIIFHLVVCSRIVKIWVTLGLS